MKKDRKEKLEKTNRAKKWLKKEQEEVRKQYWEGEKKKEKEKWKEKNRINKKKGK